MFNIIYPADYFNLKKVDEMFTEEAENFQTNGINVYVWNGKEIPSGNYLYRGWMLTEDEYKDLELFMEKNNSKLLVSLDEYLGAHYLKNWYEKLKDLTPETLFTDLNTINETLNKSDWDKFFVKDYVKSLTTSNGSIANSKEDVLKIINEIDKKKGIVGGISLRKVEDFINDSEIRYFCFNGKVLSPFGEVPDIVNEVSKRIDLPFYSIDVIQDKKGKEWIIEIGDGQVSDLKLPWKIENFVNGIKNAMKKKNKYKP